MSDSPRELSTWKEIAAYLGVSVRTAQNWEAEKQLPVSRLGPRGRISVTTADLDAWKHSNLQGARRLNGQRFLRWYAAGLTAVLLAGLAVAAVYMVRERGRNPASYRVDPGRLVILDTSGRELWSVAHPDLASAQAYGYVEQAGMRVAWFGDLDGRGETEVLFNVVYKTEGGPLRHHALVCYSRDGREQWRFMPGRRVSTAAETFDPPFTVRNFAVGPLRRGGPNRIAIVSAHGLFHPAQIALLSSGGKLLREYWHAGHLPALVFTDLDGDGASEIYAAGVNNARKMATLVVLDPDRFSGAADERDTPAYQFRGFGPGVERARILFPRTCLTDLRDVWNIVNLLTLEKRTLIVAVNETPHGYGAAAYYHLDHRLRLAGVTLGDGFEISHSRFRAEGRLDHDLTPAELERLRDITFASGGPIPEGPPPR